MANQASVSDDLDRLERAWVEAQRCAERDETDDAYHKAQAAYDAYAELNDELSICNHIGCREVSAEHVLCPVHRP